MNFTLTFPQRDSVDFADGREGVVRHVAWRLVGTDEAGNTEASCGSFPVVFDPDAAFIPLDQLTDETLQEWAARSVDFGEMRAAIEASLIARLASPALVEPETLPERQVSRLNGAAVRIPSQPWPR